AAGEVLSFPRMCSERSFSAKQLYNFPRARSAERFPSVSSTPRSTAQFISSFRQILPEPLKHCVGFPFDDLSFYFLEREMNNVVMMLLLIVHLLAQLEPVSVHKLDLSSSTMRKWWVTLKVALVDGCGSELRT